MEGGPGVFGGGGGGICGPGIVCGGEVRPRSQWGGFSVALGTLCGPHPTAPPHGAVCGSEHHPIPSPIQHSPANHP